MHPGVKKEEAGPESSSGGENLFGKANACIATICSIAMC